MPLYLCQAGAGKAEPWRQGVTVYAQPHGGGGEEDHAGAGAAAIRRVRHAEVVLVDDICIAYGQYWLRLRWPGHKGGFAGYIYVRDVVTHKSLPPPPPPPQPFLPEQPDQDDDVDALEEQDGQRLEYDEPAEDTVGLRHFASLPPAASEEHPDDTTEGAVIDEEEEEDDGMGEEELDADDVGVTAAEPDTTYLVSCLRTGLPFLTSQAMRLLPVYDDGLVPPTSVVSCAGAAVNLEPVFCRICREGLHDDADEEQPSPAEENDAEDTNIASAGRGGRGTGSDQILNSRQSSLNIDELHEQNVSTLLLEPNTEGGMGDRITSAAASGLLAQNNDNNTRQLVNKGPVFPPPHYAPNPHALENPLLAPCECSGSMAFVHYLCVEQWRCRSRHPEALNGLNCETCGSAYTLPPPSSRPVAQAIEPQAEDWLDAMPPHVMQALRQPHILWQIGAAVVRRRWLRPFAPIFMSPIVALYCRARRLLKKRGVARRRWACSLCRRRARWKCVRCLRSYYCSRQCQNVSWHIVHKHVCYKPSRLWWSTVVYGALTFLVFPGILRDPFMYDLGLFLIPFSFIVIGIIAGGIATLSKKSFALDIRGRMLELVVVLGTVWLTAVSWGLVQGFFGNPSACVGTWGRTLEIKNLSSDAPSLYLLRRLVLKPAQSYYLMWDRLVLHSGGWLSSILCLQAEDANRPAMGCFEYLPHADANFFWQSTSVTTLEEEEKESKNEMDVAVAAVNTGKCAADLALVGYLYAAAVVSYAGSAIYKYHERRQRRQPRQAVPGRHHHHHHRGGPRPHQD